MENALEQTTIRKAAWRLLPLIFFMSFCCIVDRVNLAYAALTMNADLGLSATMYGLGVSVFFLSFVLFQVPSNLLAERLGPRIWIARIMITWGLVCAGMAFITGFYGFLTLRFLLGVAEAGFFPGMILYLTLWFPRAYRVRVVAALMVAAPLTGVVGAPLTTSLMQIEAFGFHGWQWVFLLEGIPSILLGISVLFLMPDRPAKARWLKPEQREWLEQTLLRERNELEAVHGAMSIWRAMIEPRVVALGMIHLGHAVISYEVTYFLPQIIKSIGMSVAQTGFVAAIPWVAGTTGMIVIGWFSGRVNDLAVGCGVAMIGSALGLAGVAWFGSTWWVLIPASLTSFCLWAAEPMFWALPPMFLSRRAAATGIAVISSVGNLGGVVGPTVVGWGRDVTNSFAGGLYCVAAIAVVAGILVIATGPRQDSAGGPQSGGADHAAVGGHAHARDVGAPAQAG
jgi:MFS transporter, ACS family, tartrate transporter